MFTLNEFNLLLGVTWDEPWQQVLHIIFHEEEEGFTQEVSVHCGMFRWRFTIQTPMKTAHLPSTMIFRASDLRALFRKLKAGYRNIDVPLPLEFYREGVEVKNGPARGTKVLTFRQKEIAL